MSKEPHHWDGSQGFPEWHTLLPHSSSLLEASGLWEPELSRQGVRLRGEPSGHSAGQVPPTGRVLELWVRGRAAGAPRSALPGTTGKTGGKETAPGVCVEGWSPQGWSCLAWPASSAHCPSEGSGWGSCMTAATSGCICGFGVTGCWCPESCCSS